MRPIPQLALDFIDGAEADKHVAYRDSTGRWTIGRGHTGPEVVEGLTITQAQSDAYRFADAVRAGTRLAMAVKDPIIQGLSEHQYSALISFVLNLGEDPSWNIWALLNAGKLSAVPAEMMRFDKAHLHGPNAPAEEVPGLYNRRAAEVTLWKTADVGAAIAVATAGPEAPPSSFTRDVTTPPTAMIGKAWSASKTVVTGCIATCTTVAANFAPQIKAGADAVNSAIQPYVGQSTILQGISSHLALIGAAATAATLLFAFLKNRTSVQ